MEKNFLVFDHWHNLVAILPEERIQEAVRIADLDLPVSSYMLSEMLTLREDDSLATAMKWLNHSNSGALPVYNRWNNLVGILDSAGMDGFFRQSRRRRRA